MSLFSFFSKQKKTGIQNGRFENWFHGLYDLPVKLQYTAWRYGHLTHDEMLLQVAALTQYLKPGNVFEFGTFDGRTTVNIALNLEKSSKIYSLDLPDDVSRENFLEKEKDYMQPQMTRALFSEKKIESEVLNKIELLRADSKAFDFSRFYTNIDMVLVDGGHDRITVTSDSLNAFRMLRPGGVILWDDYNDYWPDVFEFINKLSTLLPLLRDERTGLVAYKSSNGKNIDWREINKILKPDDRFPEKS